MTEKQNMTTDNAKYEYRTLAVGFYINFGDLNDFRNVQEKLRFIARLRKTKRKLIEAYEEKMWCDHD